MRKTIDGTVMAACLIIVYCATGRSIKLSNLQFNGAVLVIGLVAEYLLSGCSGLSAFISSALTFTFLQMSYLEEKRQNGGFVLDEPLPEAGTKFVGPRGLRLMAANACIVVARASMISILLLILLQMASFSLCFSWS